MAQSSRNTEPDRQPETASSHQQSDTAQQEDTRDSASVDVVAMPSIKADGSPDQTPAFKTLDEQQPGEQTPGHQRTEA
jgi:hypothetical protein